MFTWKYSKDIIWIHVLPLQKPDFIHTQVSPLASFTSISYPFPTTGIPLGNFNSENMNAIVAYNSTWWTLDTRKNWNIDLNKSRIVLKRKCGLGALNGCTSYHYINRKAKITLSMQSNTAIWQRLIDLSITTVLWFTDLCNPIAHLTQVLKIFHIVNKVNLLGKSACKIPKGSMSFNCFHGIDI